LFKICVIGCGWISDFGHGKAYQKYVELNPDVELSACCDINENRAAAFKAKYGFKRFETDYLRMLKNEKPDAVCLNVPDNLIAPFAEEVLKGGYPLLMEKPPGINVQETLHLIKVAEETGTSNMVAFNRRFMPIIQLMKKVINESGETNNLQNIQYNLFRHKRTESNFEITAIHGVDAVRYLTGSDYKKVYFNYQLLPEYGDNVMNIYMYCEMESGVRAVLTFSPASGSVIERVTVNSFNNSFFAEIPVWDSMDAPGKVVSITKNEIVKEIYQNRNVKGLEEFQSHGFYDEDIIFFDLVRSGQNPSLTVAHSLQTAEIMECIREKRSKYSG